MGGSSKRYTTTAFKQGRISTQKSKFIVRRTECEFYFAIVQKKNVQKYLSISMFKYYLIWFPLFVVLG